MKWVKTFGADSIYIYHNKVNKNPVISNILSDFFFFRIIIATNGKKW